MDSDRIEASRIFIFGQIGQKLKELDDRRLLAIAHERPHRYLSTLANEDIEALVSDLMESGELDLEAIGEINELDNTFREIAKFLHESDDMLSTGSFILGQIENESAHLKINQIQKRIGGSQ